MRRSLTPLAATVVVLAVPAAAAAQVPTPVPAPQPAPVPAPPPAPVPKPKPKPKPKAGKATVKVGGGQATRKMRYVARGGALRVRGVVKPYVKGQVLLVEITRRKKVVARKTVKVGRKGRISVRMKATRTGMLKVRLRHKASVQQAAFVSRGVRVKSVVLSAGQGSRGTKVLLLQRGLAKMGYAVPRTGFYDGGTARAVLAFHKVNNQRRDGFADKGVYSLVLQGRGGFRLRFPKAGRHVEFDWNRQVLVLADKGRARRIYHASSGKPSTPTVFGTYRFYRREPGTNSHGMVQSTYFIRGYAVHGYVSVPSYAASHGCIRVPIPNALDIYHQVSLGEQIMVYR